MCSPSFIPTDANAHSKPGRSSKMYGPASNENPSYTFPEASPPASARASSTCTRNPIRASRSAAVSPPIPAPITTTFFFTGMQPRKAAAYLFAGNANREACEGPRAKRVEKTKRAATAGKPAHPSPEQTPSRARSRTHTPDRPQNSARSKTLFHRDPATLSNSRLSRQLQCAHADRQTNGRPRAKYLSAPARGLPCAAPPPSPRTAHLRPHTLDAEKTDGDNPSLLRARRKPGHTRPAARNPAESHPATSSALFRGALAVPRKEIHRIVRPSTPDCRW